MATKTYLISDGLYREQYPMHNLTSTDKFYACQWIEQTITLRDFLGDNLWNEVFAIAVKSAPEDYESTLLEMVQNLLVWYTAQALEDFDRTSANDNKVSAIKGKRNFYEKKIQEFIAETEELVTVQSDDTEPTRTPYNGVTHFFR